MFLDPEPKRRKTSRDMSAGSFFSQRPTGSSTRDPSRAIWRQALHERTKSQINQQGPGRVPDHPTVRLVNPSPPPPSQHTSFSEYVDQGSKENWQENQGDQARPPQSDWSEEEASASSLGLSAASRDWAVSDSHDWTNNTHVADRSPGRALLPSRLVHELPLSTWHPRSTSSGTYSQSSTLHESDTANSKKSLKSERYSNFSQISTLRGTPTLYEQEYEDRIDEEKRTRSESGPALHTLQETSPERPERSLTIRAVPPSDSSSSIKTRPLSEAAEISPSRPRASSFDLEQPPRTPPLPRKSSKRSYSTGSLRTARNRANTPTSLVTPSTNHSERSESQAISEVTFPQASSPNFIVYSPGSASQISREGPLRTVTSIESINSRLQYGSFARPETGQTLASSSSWASLRSNDTLPPLQVPRKRLRHKAKSESLASLASSSHADTMMEEDIIDTLPWSRQLFSSHLSTIASESDHSRSASHHASHFSLGSGVLTGDDANSLPLSPMNKRRSSVPVESIASSLRSPGTRGTTSSDFVDEAGDMTLGTFREESAIPQPLFRTNQARLLDTSKKYDGPLPPLPPVPGPQDSDEHFDTLSALQAPPLRQQKSGRSLRRRSNSTPGHSRQQSQVSYVDSERFSQGSNLFPIWAKRFYSGTADLHSKISLSSLTNSERRPGMHRRNQSSYTDRSITNRLGNGRGDAESCSPVSSHFLPSIFRPRTRPRNGGGSQSSHSSHICKSRRSRQSQDTRGSMTIGPAPPLPSDVADINHEFLPSGQPRWGTLKSSASSSPETQRRLPKKYSKQHLWDQMEFPRPMTKDRLSDFSFNAHQPHLAPSKRTSQQRLSQWRAPSFVSSFDTLFTSKQNRQILCFMLGFLCPLLWMLGAVLPLPKRPLSTEEFEKNIAGSEEDVQTAMMTHEAGDAEKRWREEQQFLKGRWWRTLNRIMSVVGVLVIGAVIALAVVATTS